MLPHRPALVGLVLSICLAALIAGSTASAEDPEQPGPSAQQVTAQGPTGPIATTAMKYLSGWGGQCWTFMRGVILEATGLTVGFDFRQGFFDTGAIDVSAAEAREGDVIQLANDANTVWWASYPGLHTAIILENLGGGRFNAIDSNQNWDEMVRLRPGYDPYAAAARYWGITVHIYRFPIGGGTSGGGGSTFALSPPLQLGERARVNTPGDVLNLRATPGIGGTIMTELAHASEVTVVDGPQLASGLRWLKVQSSAGTGWVADLYLVKATAAAGVPKPFRSHAPALTSSGAEP